MFYFVVTLEDQLLIAHSAQESEMGEDAIEVEIEGERVTVWVAPSAYQASAEDIEDLVSVKLRRITRA